MPEELADAPAMPKSLEYLWAYFLEFHLVRGSNGFGPLPINFSEILAWSKLFKVKLDAWEINTLIQLDRAYLTVVAKHESNSND